MNSRKRLLWVVVFILITLLLSGCGPGQMIEPTQTPIPPTSTNTPVPPTATDTPVPPTETPVPTQASAIIVSGCFAGDDCPDADPIEELSGEGNSSGYGKEYKISTSANKRVSFFYGWCTTDRETLDENLENMEFVLTIDDVSHVQALRKEYFESEDPGNPAIKMPCYGVGGVASGWEDAHTYRVIFGVIFHKAIFDGWDNYPPSERTSTYLITTASGLPAPAKWNGIPIMPGALDGKEDMGDYQFIINSPATEIKAFYKDEMAVLGWELRQDMMDSIPTDLAFQKGGSFVFFKITPDGNNNAVMIHVVSQ